MIYYYLRQMLEKLDELELFTRRRILQGVARIMTTEFPMEFICDMQLALEAYYPDYDLKSFLIREDKIYYYDAFLNTLTLIDRFNF